MRGVAIVLLLFVAACGRPDPNAPRETSPRQHTTVTTPGVTVSGSAEFGVTGRW
ncbi:hypothetical protein GGR95_002658 [Sulfitobacter undariae]|uniref:Uncharacterized protein n=1 Tax=Sulfitobacter undariae TaxID=1563671 RepID=A0A7W6EB81_9RHOB|nr:argininosuccinate lyase [Sulfitobacter undariae]MBB3995008.1 hypothetical protein [Sulfitobacter undariae]